MQNPFTSLIGQAKRSMRKLTPLEVASRELVEAELSLLESQSAVEYAQSIVTYNRARIARLRDAVRVMSAEQKEAQ